MKKSGLILEGGGMRGVFTAGVLDCFLDHGIEFPEVIGVSAGACHACSFVSKQRGRAKSIGIDYVNDRRYCSIYSLITTGDLFGVEFVYNKIPQILNPFDHVEYNASKTKVIAVVTNVRNGKAEYHPLKNMESDINNLRASASLPYVSRLVQLKDNLYLDGGLSDLIPIHKMEQDGYQKNIVVLTQPKGYRKKKNKVTWFAKVVYRKYPKIEELLKNRHLLYNETVEYIETQELLGNILVIQPTEKLSVGRIEKDKEKLEAVYEIGYKRALGMMERIKYFYLNH